MNRSYKRGRAAEYMVAAALTGLGYEAVRMAGSHGKQDVIAWNTQRYRHIQVKTFQTKKPPSYAGDVQKLLKLDLPPNASRELWIRRARQHGWYARYLVEPPEAGTEVPKLTLVEANGSPVVGSGNGTD